MHAAAVADRADVHSSLTITFDLTCVKRVSYGAKKADATIAIPDLGEIDVDFFIPTNGRENFVAARAVRSKFTGQFERVARLDADCANSVQEKLVAHLDGEDAQLLAEEGRR